MEKLLILNNRFGPVPVEDQPVPYIPIQDLNPDLQETILNSLKADEEYEESIRQRDPINRLPGNLLEVVSTRGFLHCQIKGNYSALPFTNASFNRIYTYGLTRSKNAYGILNDLSRVLVADGQIDIFDASVHVNDEDNRIINGVFLYEKVMSDVYMMEYARMPGLDLMMRWLSKNPDFSAYAEIGNKYVYRFMRKNYPDEKLYESDHIILRRTAEWPTSSTPDNSDEEFSGPKTGQVYRINPRDKKTSEIYRKKVLTYGLNTNS